MDKTILVTGASGFTGRHFIAEALAKGYRCIALCKPKDSLSNLPIRQIQADITNKKELELAIKNLNFDFVVHLAAISFVGHGVIDDFYNTNVIGTTNLVDVISELNKPIDKILVASSGNVYGNSGSLPIYESTEYKPANDYAVSKCAMELALQLRNDKSRIVVVRPFNYTGVGQNSNFLIPKLVNAFRTGKRSIELGNIDVYRDFSDVRDVVNAYLMLLDNESVGTYNVCSGKSVALVEVVEYLNLLSGYQIDVKVNNAFVRDNEVKELYGSNEKLVQTIGEYSSFSLQDTIKWMYHS